MRQEIRNWWEQAKKDLITAKNSSKMKDYYASAFWCQQSVEKSLKALILHKFREKFIPEHSLVRLGQKVKIPKDYLKDLKKLSPQYFLARYPDATEEMPYELYEEETVKEFIEISEKILKWIKNQLE
ncbi:MAG: HEPN domain-containing protein [Nanoarchaeota archaeon]|nr:HEPN domain-containing protein [Nanoarchaeota archaeon]